MLNILSHRAIALVLPILCITALARLVPKDLARRQICVDDDILLSLIHWSYDAEEWCRARLPITDITVAAFTVTARITATVINTTVTTVGDTTFAPSSTSTITISAPSLQRRTTSPTPAVSSFLDVPFVADINDGSSDENLYSSVLSGCGCLFLQTRTIQVVSTVKTTRTLRATEYDRTVTYSTITSGITTKYTTLAQPALMASNVPTPVPSQISALPSPPSVNSTLILTISVSPIPSVLGPCPAADNNIYTFSGDSQFLVECYTHRAGVSTLGLNEPNFWACVQACTIANDGFSSTQCYGVSYFPNNQGVNCFFKTLGSISVYNVSSQEISARLLLNNTTNYLNTSGLNTSADIPSFTSGISKPSANIRISPNASIVIPSSVASAGVSLSVPSLSVNLTGTAKPSINVLFNDAVRDVPLLPSITPINSLNITSFTSSGFPVPTPNATVSLGGTAIDFRNVLFICSSLHLIPTETSVYSVTKTVISTSVHTLVITSSIIKPTTPLLAGIIKPI